MEQNPRPCPECGPEWSRRDFVKAAAGAAAAALTAGRAAWARRPAGDSSPEELVKRLHASLSDEQRKVVAFSWDNPRRTRVSNNWRIVDVKIEKFYTGEQQEIISDIFRGLVSGDGWERFQRSMKDDYGGLGNYSCCVFGDPAAGPYEWVLTGRHVTIRCDGNSTPGKAFGGPMFYGHAVEFNERPDHPGNVWWHQARLANKIFGSLGGKQREAALLKNSPPDTARSIDLKAGGFAGLSVGEMSSDQKALVEQCMRELLAPYREGDVAEAMEFVKQGGGIDGLHLAFYREDDLGDDGIWDRWTLQGPSLSWYFRGSPHVHTWVNVGAPA